ncbi:MAG: 50S ribosomal protein L18, partial [archaeon]
MSTSTFITPFRRRAEGRTNYVKRLAFLKSGMPRVVIRKSSGNVTIQCIETTHGKDHIVAAAHTVELPKFNYAGHKG